jgi:ABC-type glycerol-3-phosphate transport system permease component
MIYPIVWMVLGSFKANAEIFSPVSFLPSKWMFENYSKGWYSIPSHNFGQFFGNSLFVTLLVITGTLISTTLAGFAFARLKFPFQKAMFALVMATLMLPNQILLIPRYVMFANIGWTGSILPLTVPAYFAQISGAFFIYLAIQFMRGIPKELDEAAVVDGCSYFSVFFRILLPNCSPVIVTICIFSFIWTWDDFMNQLLFLNKINDYTISLALRLFIDNQAMISWGQLFSMSTLSLVPPLIIFFFMQRYFVEGITMSGIKA